MTISPLYRALGTLLLLTAAACARDPDVVVIGSKNFTESIILGELVAQELEARDVRVDRRLNLGGTFVCHQALIAGELDIYVEYTGTAFAAILEYPVEHDPAVVRATVDSVYSERWNVEWTEALGFNNTYAMLVRGETARRLGLETFSDAVPHAPEWRGGFGFEFAGRADGLQGLQSAYGFRLQDTPAAMDMGLMYRALADSTVDLIAGNSTDGQIEALDLYHLDDDRGYFPPYEAVPVVRGELVERMPVVREALRHLGGSLTEAAMRRLNYLVDGEGRSAAEVVREFRAGR